jgi:sugar lactone lactonase YvrE
MVARVSIALSLCLAIAPAAAADAVAVFAAQRAALAASRKSGDTRAYLDEALRFERFLNGSPAARMETARALLSNGDRIGAMKKVAEVLAMGQTNALLDTEAFQPLSAPSARALAANRATVLRSTLVTTIAAAGSVTEDLDVDSGSHTFYVSSVGGRRIVAVDAEGHGRTFAEAPDGWPVMALKVDARRHRLWATEVALDGFEGVAPGEQGSSVILEYDLDEGALRSRFVAKGLSLGDMVLATSGDPIIADGEGGGVYRLHAGALARIDRGDFISPQTLARCGDDRHLFVPDYVRGIAAFDAMTGESQWLATQDRYALDGIDGLYCAGAWLVATQNGATLPRVVAFRLDSTRTRIVEERVLNRSPTTDITHGVVVGTAFFYLARAGWADVDEHGRSKPGQVLPAPVIMRARLRDR